ncbi:MAG: tRNA pseudouridine(55) synthase TruB [Oscillospiraceae bacterium]|nr:tRNA pseudouridine(55) synthase TruB [Oscillospiraceae bacterium]
MNGLLILDKPAGMTSFRCCGIARRILNIKKAGHAGTLDPMATGVLPIMLGGATKFLDWLPEQGKRYTAAFRFGFTSDTLDCWGTVTPTAGPIPSLAGIEALLPRFRGEILQIPPMVSALKQDGVRLYQLARQGVEVERPARPVTVHTLEIIGYDPAAGELTLDCACSKGTYIRSIGDDLGRLLDCGAVMTALRRTTAAGFTLEQAVTLERIEAMTPEQAAETLIPVDTVLAVYPVLTVSAAQAVRFRNGGGLAAERLGQPDEFIEGGIWRLYAPDGDFLGLGQMKNGQMTVQCLMLNA